ncbi:MFS transporter [Rhodococcus opacus]|nr:MFS transporter [Rhodococcus opacus]
MTMNRVRRAVVVGSALEWFDFYLYASMAALVFGPIFFPSENSANATLAAFATFAVGFLARPVGGILFGVIADRVGRKRVLSISFLLMGGSSVLIGLIPTYASIGILAPILLVAFRILQGLGAGAEVGSAMAVAYEHAVPGSRGRQGAWTALGVNIGLFASAVAVAGLTSLDRELLQSWAWRIPFVASLVLVVFGLWIRRQMPETPEFEQVVSTVPNQKKARPLRDLFKSEWRGLAVVMVITFGYNGVSYTFKTFSLSYLTQFRDVAANVGAVGIMLASGCAIVIAPLAGRLCDQVDAARVIYFGAAGTAAMAFPFFWLLNSGKPTYIWAALILTTGILVPAMLAASGSFLARQFPAKVRTSGLGTGREVSGAIAGALAPLGALTMVTMSSDHATRGVSTLFLIGATCIAVGCMFDQQRRVNSRSLVDPVEQRISR